MNTPLILFPEESFSDGRVDSEFALEEESARSVGFATALYDHEDLQLGAVADALSRVPDSDNDQCLILRGWMVPGEIYTELHSALVAKGYRPINTPYDYEQAHYIPGAYPQTVGHTPRTEWIDGDDPDRAWAMYQGFKGKDAIIKDWVKSAKSRWKEGCFIPSGTNEEAFRQIYHVFREERSKLFNRGVVLREFMPIVEKGSDIRGLPIIEETRLFFWKGKLVVSPAVASPSPMDEIERWEMIADRFSSSFMTIDVAHLKDGSWKIVEVGDGGVSGLPVGMEPERFYGALWNCSTCS